MRHKDTRSVLRLKHKQSDAGSIEFYRRLDPELGTIGIVGCLHPFGNGQHGCRFSAETVERGVERGYGIGWFVSRLARNLKFIVLVGLEWLFEVNDNPV